MSPATGVIARWAGGTRTGNAAVCDECGDTVERGQQCPRCRQLAAGAVGMLAAVIDAPTGARLVIAERAPNGAGWVPVTTAPATAEAVRAVRRSCDATEGESAADFYAIPVRADGGGLR